MKMVLAALVVAFLASQTFAGECSSWKGNKLSKAGVCVSFVKGNKKV